MPTWMAVGLVGSGYFYEFMMNGNIRAELYFILWLGEINLAVFSNGLLCVAV